MRKLSCQNHKMLPWDPFIIK
uniref:Uncharacterized protein n=1 Tax=Arundo donax TaxID=35708 RepID=A0A0A8YYY8_ARUDO